MSYLLASKTYLKNREFISSLPPTLRKSQVIEIRNNHVETNDVIYVSLRKRNAKSLNQNYNRVRYQKFNMFIIVYFVLLSNQQWKIVCMSYNELWN